ncbi:MAG: radical SAM protein, partial [Oligoflexia bacterium]|nr:radical SAM protein [Oligoflexia bacterium]
ANQQAKPKKYIAYFQSYSNTYGKNICELKTIYDEAIGAHKDIVGISISTRADSIDEEKIKLINSYTKKVPYVAIEYGMQSIYNKTLDFFERKETHENFLEAIRLTKKFPKIHICAHVILGSFTESREEILYMAKYLGELKIDGVKLHILTILKNTNLSTFSFNNSNNIHNHTKYFFNHLSTFKDTVTLLADFIEHLPSSIVIHKIAGYGHIDDVLYPSWIKLEKDRILIHVKNELIKRRSKLLSIVNPLLNK